MTDLIIYLLTSHVFMSKMVAGILGNKHNSNRGVVVADVVRASVLVVWVPPAWVRTL